MRHPPGCDHWRWSGVFQDGRPIHDRIRRGVRCNENLGKGWGAVVVHLIGISPVAIVLTRSLSPAQADDVTALLRRMLAQAPSVADLGVETLQEDANHWVAGWEGVQVNVGRR